MFNLVLNTHLRLEQNFFYRSLINRRQISFSDSHHNFLKLMKVDILKLNLDKVSACIDASLFSSIGDDPSPETSSKTLIVVLVVIVILFVLIAVIAAYVYWRKMFCFKSMWTLLIKF